MKVEMKYKSEILVKRDSFSKQLIGVIFPLSKPTYKSSALALKACVKNI